jgi:hypothetical protein
LDPAETNVDLFGEPLAAGSKYSAPSGSPLGRMVTRQHRIGKERPPTRKSTAVRLGQSQLPNVTNLPRSEGDQNELG